MAKIQPTAEQWREIERQLGNMHDTVYLDCDGFLVALTLRRVKEMSLGIAVYVNNWFKGEWLGFGPNKPPTEEGRRFYQERTLSLYRGKEKAQMRRAFGKRVSEKKVSYRAVCWASAGSLRRHLVANNESINVLTYEEHRTRIDALPKEDADTKAEAVA